MNTSPRRCRCPLGAIVSLCLLFAVRAGAHDVGLSSALLRLQSDKVEAVLTFAPKDIEAIAELDANRDGRVTPGEFSQARPQLDKLFSSKCVLSCNAQRIEPSSIHSQLDDTNNVVIQLDFPARQFKELEVSFGVIRDLTPGHRMFVSLLGLQGGTLAERLVSQDAPSLCVVLDSANGGTQSEVPQTFLGFLKLGVEHIGTGYDHLLFLFGLLIVARSFKSSLVIISCFTLAHTITLGLATFGFSTLRPSIAEPLIALSIVYVGLENLIRHGDPKGRWLLTFAFGLIHGFGFASVLRDLGVGANGSGVTMPLFAFNFGVELGQLAVAAIALPVIWRLRQKEVFVRRFVPACSMVVALLGAWWVIERV